MPERYPSLAISVSLPDSGSCFVQILCEASSKIIFQAYMVVSVTCVLRGRSRTPMPRRRYPKTHVSTVPVPRGRLMTKKINIFRMAMLLSVAAAIAGCESVPATQPVTRAASPPPAAAPQAVERDYLINPGDVLEVSVWKEEGMDKEVLVLPDGTFAFPLVGFVDAAGHSPADVQKTLSERIKRFIPYPVVTVAVGEVSGNSVFVLGHVEKPGEYRASRPLDVLQALSLAGGLTIRANERDIKIVRRENGQQRIYPFNFIEFKNGLGLESNIILNSGDTVIVPGSSFWQ